MYVEQKVEALEADRDKMLSAIRELAYGLKELTDSVEALADRVELESQNEQAF